MEKSGTYAYALDRVLISVILGFALGIIFDAFFRFRFDLYVIFFVGIVSLLFAILCPPKHMLWRAQYICVYVSIMCFSLFLGIARLEVANFGLHMLENSVGQKITLVGVIDTPIQKTYNQQSRLTTSDGQTVLIYTQKYPTLSYGEKISVTGVLQKPKNFMTNQGSEFDYVSYLYKDDIVYVVPNGKAEIVSQNNGNVLIGPLISFKNWFVAGYQRILPPEEADLMGGLTLGTKENISNEFRDSLVETSTIHIIALSGYNVTIVANFLRGILLKIPFLGARGALVGGGIGIIFFVMMTGMQSSAIRAGIMALVALFGRGTGRTYDAFRALVLAGCIMIVWNPKFLIYDVSFQLSFLATLGMIFLTPLFLNVFKKVPENLFNHIPLRELVSTTLGAQTAVVPFIIYKMGMFSLIALPANIFVLPTVPLAMGVGTIAGIIGNVSITLATPFAFVTHLLLRYIITLVNFFASIPFAYITFTSVSVYICLVLYVGLICWIYKSRDIFL